MGIMDGYDRSSGLESLKNLLRFANVAHVGVFNARTEDGVSPAVILPCVVGSEFFVGLTGFENSVLLNKKSLAFPFDAFLSLVDHSPDIILDLEVFGKKTDPNKFVAGSPGRDMVLREIDLPASEYIFGRRRFTLAMEFLMRVESRMSRL